MRIILTAVEDSLADAWERFCGGVENVSIHRGSIFDVHCDALVSPANSFGFMDGGIDALYTQWLGHRVQQRLQDLIRTRHYGEQLVRQAEIVHTDDPSFPFLISAPMMRVPMILRDSVNPYLALRAVIRLVKHGVFPDGEFTGEPIANVVKTVAVPGLGTGIGGIGPNMCARQVKAAIDEHLRGERSYPGSWADAQARHQLLYTDRIRDLQKG